MAKPGATDAAAGVTDLEAAPAADSVPALAPNAAHAATHAAKKKKKKTKRAADAADPVAPSLAATAQVQADLLATASDLYRRIEADPVGLPDDEAYWTSLPAHLRTFIRNALPLGHLAEPGANANAVPRHASTQAMIAVAQQLAQAAHASQRPVAPHAQNTYSSPLALDPSMFVDTPMFADLPLTKNAPPHLPSPGMQAAAVPGENGFGSVVLVNELDEDDPDFHDEFASDDPLDDPLDKEPAPKKKLKKKKKKSAPAALDDPAADAQLPRAAPPPPPPPAIPPPLPLPKRAPSAVPPSARAAGKLPMTFAPRTTSTNAPPRAPLAKRTPKLGNAAAPAHAPHRAMFPPQMPGAAPPASGSGLTIGSAEEREQIREFWHTLPQKQRRQLVDAEQQDVQRKLRDFQRHACACRICARKRSAIDAKLRELYTTYYDALEAHASQYARHRTAPAAEHAPPGPGPFPGSIALDSQGGVVGANLLLSRQPHGRGAPDRRRTPYGAPLPALEPGERRAATPPTPDVDELYDPEPLDDEEYDEEYDDGHPDDDLDADLDAESERDAHLYHHGERRGDTCSGSDCYCINSSLTVKGILTVADDLSGNEVQKLILMMEQLAERHLGAVAPDDDAEELDAEDDASLASEVELTPEEQREQGWRMFQIFAARILEHRVLHAYRETVAQERQLQLLRELEEEESNEKAREAKRAKENQRKKDKKRLLRQQKEEEKLRKEQERAAEEAAVRAEQEKQRQLELRKQEELRLQREAERRAKEEERARREEERRRAQEERDAERRRAQEREAERRRAQERKHAQEEREREEKRRAQEERERKKKEERRKAAEARDAKKREAARAAPPATSPPRAAGGPFAPSPSAAAPRAAPRPPVGSPPSGAGLPLSMPSLHAVTSPPAAPLAETPAAAWASPPRMPPFALYDSPRASASPRPPFFDVNATANSLGRMHLESPLRSQPPVDYGLSLPRRPAGAPGAPGTRSPTRAAPGPIGPIERPRRVPSDESHALRPEGILGSAALGDDELIEPRVPRRAVPNVAPISTFAQPYAYPSPWSAPGNRSYSSPFGSAPQAPDPWAKPQGAQPPGWERARFAFEQPGAFEPDAGLFTGLDSLTPIGKPPGGAGGAAGSGGLPRGAAPFTYPAPMRPAFSNGL